jgi:3-isopropylmalate dehydrogenase
MMMDYLGRKNNDEDLVAVGRLIDESVADHLKAGSHLTYDLGGTTSCSAVGESIAARLAEKLKQR